MVRKVPAGARRLPKMTAEMVNANRAPVAFDHTAAFKPAVPPPGVLPKDKKPIAMDEAWGGGAGGITWANQNLANIAFNQGYTFLGYPYLAELAQVAEYRLISEVISTEATRKWIKIKSAADDVDSDDEESEGAADLALGEEDDDEVETGEQGKEDKAKKAAAAAKAAKIEELEDEFDRLGVRNVFAAVSLQDGLFGRAHIYIDTGSTDDPKELVTPIGDGNKFTLKKFKKGFLRGLKTVEPVWTYPLDYNAIDPLKDAWYDPQVWYVMSKGVHVSRLLTFVGKPVPDLMKPSFSFGGLSMTQMAKPYVDNWLETRQSVNDIIQAFSVMVLSTDMSAILQDAPGGGGLLSRADLFNNIRNDKGVMMLDKNSEEFSNVSAPLASLDKLQAQAQEHMASVSRIPLVKLLGSTPAGLNASSDGEIRAFYDTIHAYQENFFGPHLKTIFKLAQINIWGAVDEDLTYDFEPLWELDEKSIAEMRKAESETHKNYIDCGAIAPEEVRQSLADDDNSPYSNLDPDDVPEPILEPENVKDPDGSAGGGGSKSAGPGAAKPAPK